MKTMIAFCITLATALPSPSFAEDIAFCDRLGRGVGIKPPQVNGFLDLKIDRDVCAIGGVSLIPHRSKATFSSNGKVENLVGYVQAGSLDSLKESLGSPSTTSVEDQDFTTRKKIKVTWQSKEGIVSYFEQSVMFGRLIERRVEWKSY